MKEVYLGPDMRKPLNKTGGTTNIDGKEIEKIQLRSYLVKRTKKGICQNPACGKEFEVKTNARVRKFCCDACREAMESKAKSKYPMNIVAICEHCNSAFHYVQYQNNQIRKYCCDSCRSAAYKKICEANALAREAKGKFDRSTFCIRSHDICKHYHQCLEQRLRWKGHSQRYIDTKGKCYEPLPAISMSTSTAIDSAGESYNLSVLDVVVTETNIKNPRYLS